jgi:hypothetical protein
MKRKIISIVKFIALVAIVIGFIVLLIIVFKAS